MYLYVNMPTQILLQINNVRLKMVKKVRKSKISKVAGTNLKRIRKELKLSQQAVADMIGSAQTYISLIERGSRDMTASFARELIKGFKKNHKRSVSPQDFGLTE
jgi:DNA-binding XRE family transcriptional regulator